MKKNLLKKLFLLLFITQVSTEIQAIIGNSKPQVNSLQSGSIYSIISKVSNNTLSVSNSSLNDNANVYSWTNTNSDAGRWIATNLGNEVYTFTNVASGKLLHAANANPGDATNVNQHTNTNDNTVKWRVMADGNSYFSLHSLANENFVLDVNGGNTGNGTNVQVWSNLSGDAQKWSFQLEDDQEEAPSAAVADKMFEAWSLKYNIVNDNGFWGTAEMMEIVLDSYETTGNPKYKNMFNQMYTNFISNNGQDWMNNDFNDDITWISIACVRSYILTGNTTHLNKAKDQFDKMFARAKTGVFDEGLIWKQGVEGTNSAINGPAMVALCYLAKATGDVSYYNKAITIYNWAKEYMFNTESGKVIDAYYRNTNTGQMETNDWSSTYNQGTFMGASIMLYNYTKDGEYLRIADNLAKFTKENMFSSGVMNSEDFGNDAPGFKGIFMRYARKYVIDGYRPTYLPWLYLNAKVAYNNRNTENITSTLWAEKTKENDTGMAFSSSTAVSLLINYPISISNSFVKNAYEKIEAEDFDYLKGVIVEPSSDGTSNLGGVRDGYYTGYHNVDFGQSGAKNAEFRVASFNGGTIEIRVGGENGTLIGSAVIPGTGDWSTYVTITTPVDNIVGIQSIYLVYKGSGFVVNLNHFKFNKSDSAPVTNGLLASYYNGTDLKLKVLERVDPNIQFDWDYGSPSDGINPDDFSIRWTGQIEPLYSGMYTFFITSDNGRRVWINNELIIDKWINDYNIEYSGTITLEASKRYDIKVEYFETFGGANIKLEWENQQQQKQIIPSSQLFLYPENVLSTSDIALNQLKSIKFYPNPVSDNLFVTTTNGALMTRLQCISMTGKTVMNVDVPNTTDKTINVSSLTSGVYFLRVFTNEGVITSKLIVK